VLDQDADEALQRPDDRAMQHDRHLPRVVRARRTRRPVDAGIWKSTCIVPHCHERPIESFR
jgi:hypothetical protein